MPWLVALFIVVPALELALLIRVGQQVGALPTLGLIVATGALGAYLARWQGLRVLWDLREDLAAGRMPLEPLLDGIIVLLAGAVLITPGFLTDAVGFLCLAPGTRRIVKNVLRRRLKRSTQRIHVIHVDEGPPSHPTDYPDDRPPRIVN